MLRHRSGCAGSGSPARYPCGHGSRTQMCGRSGPEIRQNRGCERPSLPMLLPGCRARRAGPALGDKRVSDQRSDACFRDRMLCRPHACFVTPTPTKGGAAALVLPPKSKRRRPAKRTPGSRRDHASSPTKHRDCFRVREAGVSATAACRQETSRSRPAPSGARFLGSGRLATVS
jgi:hypothetical protein